jgi:glycerate kinase
VNRTILVCLDEFRGSPTAAQDRAAVVDGVAGAGGRAVAMPVADGGEGTVAALVRAGYVDPAMRQAPALFRAIGRELLTHAAVTSAKGVRT